MSGDKSEKTYKLLCGFSNALLILSTLVAPAGMFLWLGAATPRQQDTIGMDVLVITVLCCFAGMTASLVMAIAAKLKEPAGKWAVICIVISAIVLVTSLLAAFITVWAASQYQYHG